MRRGHHHKALSEGTLENPNTAGGGQMDNIFNSSNGKSEVRACTEGATGS